MRLCKYSYGGLLLKGMNLDTKDYIFLDIASNYCSFRIILRKAIKFQLKKYRLCTYVIHTRSFL